MWTGPGALTLNAHALAPVAELPVLEVVSTVHLVADVTLGLGRVVYDYLAPGLPETQWRSDMQARAHKQSPEPKPLAA